MMQKMTVSAKKGEVDKRWLVVDLDGQVLGRAASAVAAILRGKNKPIYTPHVDTGDFVICLNAGKVKLTGTKLDRKMYYNYTGYPGGMRSETARELMGRKPEEIFRLAVRGMLPKNTLGRQMLKKLKIYTGDSHPHQAQKPEAVDLSFRR